jgi:Ankyrin repeat
MNMIETLKSLQGVVGAGVGEKRKHCCLEVLESARRGSFTMANGHYWGCTALTLAINAKKFGLISFLLSHGADPNTKDTVSSNSIVYSIDCI